MNIESLSELDKKLYHCTMLGKKHNAACSTYAGFALPGSSGNSMWKEDPLPSPSDSAQTLPPIPVAIFFATKSPRPVPVTFTWFAFFARTKVTAGSQSSFYYLIHQQ